MRQHKYMSESERRCRYDINIYINNIFAVYVTLSAFLTAVLEIFLPN